jgi:hypothetical protein
VDLFAVAMGVGLLAWGIGNLVFYRRVTKLFNRMRDETRERYGDARGWRYIMAVMAPRTRSRSGAPFRGERGSRWPPICPRR